MSDSHILSPRVERMESENGVHRIFCVVPPELTAFQGHFRDLPIVAGVCQLKWVVDFWQQLSGEPVCVEKLTQVKFHQFLRPGDAFCISLENKDNTVRYRIFHNDAQYASGKMVLRT